jgi:hypothetical protein
MLFGYSVPQAGFQLCDLLRAYWDVRIHSLLSMYDADAVGLCGALTRVDKLSRIKSRVLVLNA